MTVSELKHKWWIISAMTLCLGMVFVDQTIVNVALPTIQKQFQATDTQIQWIINAYLLSLACFLIFGGRLGDIFGIKRLLLIGIVIFAVSSFFCGFASSPLWLIINRAIQGIGGALLIPNLMATFMIIIPSHERGKLLGLQVSIAGIFLALGPFFGGLLTSCCNWRWIFWINLPIAFIDFWLVLAFIHLKKNEIDERVDFPGLILSIGWLLCFVLVLMQGSHWGWFSLKVFFTLIIGVVCFLMFYYAQKKGKYPLIDFSLFNNRTYLCGLIVIACIQISLISGVFSTFFLQNNLRYSPLEAGLLMLPSTFPIFILTPLAGRWYDKRGPYLLVSSGMVLVGIGMLWIALFCFFNSYLLFLPGLITYGFGVALVMSPMNASALSVIPISKRGAASGIISAARQVGASIGLAVVGALLIFGQRHQFGNFLDRHKEFSQLFSKDDVTHILNESIFSKIEQLTPFQMMELKTVAMYSFDFGFFLAMLFSSAVAFIGFFVSFYFLKDYEHNRLE